MVKIAAQCATLLVLISGLSCYAQTTDGNAETQAAEPTPLAEDAPLTEDAPPTENMQPSGDSQLNEGTQLTDDAQDRLLREIAALRKQLRELQDSVSDVPRLRQEVRDLGEEVTVLSQTDASDVQPDRMAGTVLGAMEQNEDVRKNVGTLAQGKVVLFNDRDYEVPLYINGTRWSVLRGKSYVFVPAGSVLIQRPGESRPELKGRDSWRLIDGELQMSYVIER